MTKGCPCCNRTVKELNENDIELFRPEDKGYENFEFGLVTYPILCSECLVILKDEFSDMSSIIPNESEEDFFDHENWDE